MSEDSKSTTGDAKTGNTTTTPTAVNTATTTNTMPAKKATTKSKPATTTETKTTTTESKPAAEKPAAGKPAVTPEKPAVVKKTPDHRYAEVWDDSDIILLIENEEFHCHYAILRFNSPVFRAMFKGDFKEGAEKSVKLPGKEKEGFMTFLDLMYPISSKYDCSTDRKILAKVLEYAEEYQTDSVKMHIDNILFSKVYGRKDAEKSVQIAMEDLKLSEKFELTETRRMAYNYLLSDDRTNNYEDTVYNELTGETKYDIIVGKLKKFLPSLSASQQWDPLYQLLWSLSKDEGQK